MALSIIQLRVFLAAARDGSFTAAAVRLHMSQPTVSETIRRVEQSYGTSLFVRGSRRLILSPAGEELLPLAEQTVGSADAADRALKAVTGLRGGVASIGLLRNAKHYAMADLLTSFHQRYPDVRLRVVGVNSADVADLVRGGELEAGIVVLPVDTNELAVTPLTRDEVVFVTSDPQRATAPVSIETLAATNLILYDAHAGWRDPTRRQLAERALIKGLTLEPRIEVEQVDAALDLVAAGAGESFVSTAVAASAAVPDGLFFAPFEDPLFDTIALVQRDAAVLSPATRELMRFARETLVGLDQPAIALPGRAT
ncbi:LysR family transcriptional regulator [Subtercola sp. Z020]|uniref:LysR family transcriptional regulator n=1 Tax=Subtercola sp. Z020 TaxID=2080582 RepID=UPI000CE8E1A3|nr:LysR family transcriptional regulator [Subtercola sp. Z020]PPF89514.1 LysR family transcriptional regulator [Subtercola sp. Z020]